MIHDTGYPVEMTLVHFKIQPKTSRAWCCDWDGPSILSSCFCLAMSANVVLSYIGAVASIFVN